MNEGTAGIIAQHVAALVLSFSRRSSSNGAYSGTVSKIRSGLSDVFSLDVPEHTIRESLGILMDVGGVYQKYSPLTQGYYTLYPGEVEYYISNSRSVVDDEDPYAYDTRKKEMQEKYPVVDTYFATGSDWVDEVVSQLQSLPDLDVAEIGGALESRYGIPASDRVVSLGHNSAVVQNVTIKIENFCVALGEGNEASIRLGEDKERYLAEVSAGRDIIKTGRFRVGAIVNTIVAALANLTTIFDGHQIGVLAAELLRQIRDLLS